MQFFYLGKAFISNDLRIACSWNIYFLVAKSSFFKTKWFGSRKSLARSIITLIFLSKCKESNCAKIRMLSIES